MTRNERLFDRPSRRTVLKAAVATGSFAGAGGIVGAQERTFEFDCGMRGWQARAPSDIEGETNPTLELEPGETYTIEWTNLDGFEHNFVIVDRDGNELIRTGTIDEAGQTQIVKFTATEEMTQYFCEVHPGTMRGDVSIAGREEEPTPYEQDGEAIPMGESIGLETVAEGLTAPLGFETAPGLEDRQFVVDQPGQIYVLEDDGLRDEPFINISDRIVDLGIQELRGYDERGLLGLAFHPAFRENRRFFVRYSAPRREGTPEDFDHTDVLAEFEATEDLESGDPDSERTLWEVPPPQDNHNAGAIVFGPDDGYLYTSIGDGGDADDTGPGHVDDWYDANDGGNGQDTTENLLGGIHRLDVDSDGEDGDDEGEADRAYGIPDDNPFVDSDAGLDEYYAWGFRNPRTMSFDSEGRLFVADAGQNRFEEVNLVEKGGNYGWNVKEGTHCFSTEQPSAPSEEISGCPNSTHDGVRGGEELVDPIVEYPHRFRTTAFIDGSVVIGGYVYEGDAIEHLQGKYVFGNWSGRGVVERDGEIFVATENGTTDDEAENGATDDETENGNDETTDDNQTDEEETNGRTDDSERWPLEELVVEGSDNGKLNQYVYAFGRDQDDELYALTNENFRPEGFGGEVHKLVPTEEGDEISNPGPLPTPEDEDRLTTGPTMKTDK